MSLRERILAQKAKAVVVTPSFLDGQSVEVRVMSVKERRDVFQAANNDDGNQDAAQFEAAVVIACTFDHDSGQRVFQMTDQEALAELPSDVLDQLAEPALRINGLLIGGVEAALKNSATTPSASASTGSPNASA